MDPVIRDLLLAPAMRLDRFDCSFSMVTRRPCQLVAQQRLPHVDVARDDRVALLHYLCDEGFGGTAFFRQDETGLEQVGPEARARWLDAAREAAARLNGVHGYPGDGTPGYTRTGHVPARFNRLIAYRSFTLHSGIIDAPERLSDDPATGRLTTTFFADYAPT
jgi:hypothetical protein